MIARTWKGTTRAEDAEAYLAYLERTGVSDFARTEGNRGSEVLCRRLGERAEFVVISYWDSPEAVRAFAGEEPERAVFYPEDGAFLVDREWTVSHYEVRSRAGTPGPAPEQAPRGEA